MELLDKLKEVYNKGYQRGSQMAPKFVETHKKDYDPTHLSGKELLHHAWSQHKAADKRTIEHRVDPSYNFLEGLVYKVGIYKGLTGPLVQQKVEAVKKGKQ